MTDVTRLDLPGLNYLAPLEADDFEFGENVTATEILQRFQAVFGANFVSLNGFGVISDVNPQTSSSLIMSIGLASVTDQFTYLVQPGVAVTSKGQLISITSPQTIAIPQVNGQVYVIIAQYVIDEDPSSLRYTKFHDPIKAHRDVVPSVTPQLQVMTVSDWLLLPSASIANMVPLGVVSVSTDPNTLALVTASDMTTGTYSWNRPWFSPVDYFHRSQKGNVHDLTLEELDQGAVPLMEKFLGDGFIIAQDAQYPYFPGHLCVQEVPRDQIMNSSPYSFTLSRRPVRLGRLYLKSDNSVEFGYSYYPDANVIQLQVAPPTPTGSDTMDMQLDTLVVDSFEPSLLSNTARFANVSAKGESAISQGAPIRSMTSFDVPLNDFGPGAYQRAKVFITSDGTLIRSPTTLMCQARIGIDIIGDEDVPVSKTMPLPGVLRLIVRDTVNVSGEILITGIDVNGSPLQETVTFTFDSTLPNGFLPTPDVLVADDTTLFGKLVSGDTGCVLTPEMTRAKRLITLAQCPCRYTQNVFSSVSSIRLTNLVGGSTAGSITLQALLDTRSLLQLAEIVAAEGVPQYLVDNRMIRSGLTQVDKGVDASLIYIDGTAAGREYEVVRYVDNFTDSQYGNFRVCTLIDPLNSQPIPPGGIRGDTMFYSTRLLPVYSGTPFAGTLVMLGGNFHGLSDPELFVKIEVYDIGPNGAVLLSYFNSQSVVTNFSINIGTNTAKAVRITAQSPNLKGFVLHVGQRL